MSPRAVLLFAASPVLATMLALGGCGSPSVDESAEAVTPAEVVEPSDPAIGNPADATQDLRGESEGQDFADAPSDAPSPVAGSYITYDEYVANKAAFDSTNVVLFFNAVWCSTCKEARDNIESDPASIPSDLAIIVVDFDSANDLRQTYGVTVQHTFVQIDADGNELAKWSGSVTADEIAQNTV